MRASLDRPMASHAMPRQGGTCRVVTVVTVISTRNFWSEVLVSATNLPGQPLFVRHTSQTSSLHDCKVPSRNSGRTSPFSGRMRPTAKSFPRAGKAPATASVYKTASDTPPLPQTARDVRGRCGHYRPRVTRPVVAHRPRATIGKHRSGNDRTHYCQC